MLSDTRKRNAYDNNQEVFDAIESATTELTDADFDSIVNASQPWLIQVYSKSATQSVVHVLTCCYCRLLLPWRTFADLHAANS